MWTLSSGVFLGWALGANDASNVFGTAVSSNMVRYRTAVVLASFFIVIGAVLEGSRGLETLDQLTNATSMTQAFVIALAAALTVTLMTILRLPVSVSHAVIGALLGVGMLGAGIEWNILGKIITCWIGTPVGAALLAPPLYWIFSKMLNRWNFNFFQLDAFLRYGLVLCGSYGAYTLGANNVANVSSAFYSSDALTAFEATLFGGLSIALGVITYSKNVMRTVGKGLIRLNGFSALITVIAASFTLHFYARLGVPVSSSHAIVGAVLGIGFIKGVKSVNFKTLFNIVVGWIITPLIAGLLALLLMKFSTMKITFQ